MQAEVQVQIDAQKVATPESASLPWVEPEAPPLAAPEVTAA
jgi:hypothetical protein